MEIRGGVQNFLYVLCRKALPVWKMSVQLLIGILVEVVSLEAPYRASEALGAYRWEDKNIGGAEK